MNHSPLEQFEIHTLIPLPTIFGFNIDFTNSSLYMMLSVSFIAFIMWAGTSKIALVPGKAQSLVEMGCGFVKSMVKGSGVGEAGVRYFPLVFTVFLFVLTCNLFGMLPLPASFTPTSHIAVTLALALIVFFTVTITGIVRQGREFLRLFLPRGVPLWLAPMMILIELFAYFARPISLSIRLAANMIAGHTILKVIAGFVTKIFSSMSFAAAVGMAVLPFAFLGVLIGFEIFVAILQAYIFTALTCVYLGDVLGDGH